MRSKMADAEMRKAPGAGGNVAYARPHFRRQGDELSFFLSSRPCHHLSPLEAKFWDRLEAGPVQLKSALDQRIAEILAEAGLLEIIAPVEAERRRQILVVEPHCDDAALSIGGTMWKMREDAEFHLLTMASRSNYSTAFHMHREYFNRARITEMRTAEGELFMKHLGGQYSCAGLPEATLRYKDDDWNLKFFKDHEVATAISNNRRASATVLGEWVEKLRTFLRGNSFDEIWLPLGAGTHSDHDLARDAGLRIVMEEKPDATVRLYEDVPYGKEFEEHTNRILKELQAAGATLLPWAQDVTADFPAKLSLLNIFASQFKVGAIQNGVERSASAAGEGIKQERLWTVEGLPEKLPEDRIWAGAYDVTKAAAELPKFLTDASAERRVAIFAISASGRWNEDLALLTRAFPSASFVVYAGPRVCAEFAEVEGACVDLRCMDGRSVSWLKAAFREFATGHRILIAGDALSKAKALRILWPIGRTIVVPAMDNLFQALSRR